MGPAEGPPPSVDYVEPLKGAPEAAGRRSPRRSPSGGRRPAAWPSICSDLQHVYMHVSLRRPAGCARPDLVCCGSP